MANSNQAPKQWQLTTNEKLNSQKKLKTQLKTRKKIWFIHCLWISVSLLTSRRDWHGENKEEKCTTLNLMWGQIQSYATVTSWNQIIKGSKSLNDIWGKIRQHYGFHTTRSPFLDLSTIRQQPGEQAEDLYQCLVSFAEDNLLVKDNTLTHHSQAVTNDEEISPSLENGIVLLWLERLHVGLPSLVTQRYGAELRNKTLASIKPEISQALSSLLEELSVGEDSGISFIHDIPNNRNSFSRGAQPGGKYCRLCRTANRPN